MRPLFIFLFLFLSGEDFAQLNGQWLSNKPLLECQKGDTLLLTRTKFKENFFQWGKPSYGMEFGGDQAFREYYTVMCSTESDPVVNHEERWKLEQGNIVLITGEKRTLRMKIIFIKGKNIKFKVI